MHTLTEEEYQRAMKAQDKLDKQVKSSAEWWKEARKNEDYMEKRRARQRENMKRLREKRKKEKSVDRSTANG